jgi:hypothetical protein
LHPLDSEEFRFFAGLYPHQIEGIALLTGKGRAILGDDMGLGKTRRGSLLPPLHLSHQRVW